MQSIKRKSSKLITPNENYDKNDDSQKKKQE